MPLLERSLYLYFLDRELGDAVEYRLDPATARGAVRTLAVATNARLICGLSLLYENSNLDRSTIEFFGDLVSAGILDTVSHYPSYEEFLSSRISMYRHDTQRYPAYFSNKTMPLIAPTVEKSGGTTATIVAGLTQWALQIPDLDPRYKLTSTQLREPVLLALQQREGRAVTFSLFEPYLGRLKDSPAARGHIRRVISRLFASDYISFGDNDVPTGIRGLTYFEQALAKDFPFHDVQILANFIRLTGISRILAASKSGSLWDLVLAERDSESHAHFCATLRWIIAASAEVAHVDQFSSRQDEARLRINGILRRLTVPQHIALNHAVSDDLYAAGASNASVLAKQLMEDRTMANALDRLHDDYFPPRRADVLLVVATESESEAVITTFADNSYSLATPAFSATNAYQTFSPVQGARVVLVRCSMGPGGPGGPELTVAEAIATLKPTSIIMLGIAFGVDPAQEKVGQVLLSTHVFDYGLERIGTNAKGRLVRLSRGAKPDASPRLIARFQAARLHSYGLDAKEGVLLSGNKLVDNVDYREELLALCPEAIGGEMEAYGVYSAASRASIDWIIVKAICDWADGKKRVRKAQRQEMAARNAALAVLRTLERGGFA